MITTAMELQVFSLPSFLFFSLLSLYLYFFLYSTNKKPSKGGFKFYPLVGALPAFIKNRHRFLEWTTEALKDCPTHTAVFHRPGKVHGIFTANPANVEYMLKTNFENYPKGERFVRHLEDFLGQGIFNSDGELWKVQRKTASYEFNTRSLRNFVLETVSSEISTRLIPTLIRATKTEQLLDIQDVLERFAFDNVCKVAFNFDPGCLGGDGTTGSEFMRAFDEAATISPGRFRYVVAYLWKVKKFFNIGTEKRLKNSIQIVHDFANNIIQSRLQTKDENPNEDLLSRFIANYDNSPEFLRDIIISFILAGRDTTSSALSWFFWLLSSHPNVEQNILKELDTTRKRSGKKIGDTYSFDELRDMHYLHAALSESMRLYPSVPIDTKNCLNDDVLPDGTFIGKGWFITYHVYAMGRTEAIWGENCYEFVPERWLENGVYRPENQFKYPVFQAGPRICLGKDMAYTQMKSIVASVIERFVLDVQDKDTRPKYVQSFTFKMKDGLPVKVKERCVNVIG